MLGYASSCTSFIERTTPAQWIGGQIPNWLTRYALFKQYYILNKKVQEEDEKRALSVEGAPTGQPKRQKVYRASKTTRVNPLSVTMAEGVPSWAGESVIHEPALA